jgi:4'-phosphopantetheinyl transferase
MPAVFTPRPGPLPPQLPLAPDQLDLWLLPRQRCQRGLPLLRELLARYLDCPPDALQFTRGAHGRPALAAPHDDLQFSLSDKGDWLLAAVARGVAPGVDLEALTPRPTALKLARRWFTAAEADALEALPAAQRDPAFYRLWTAREAVLKATGRGLAFGLNRLAFASDETDQLRLCRLDGDDPAAWQLHLMAAADGYLGAVAWRGAPRQLRLWRREGMEAGTGNRE